MIMPRYSPFEVAFDELETADLGVLHNVAEGWYVEYKQDASKADAMAKSVSAFANTYGGWIFYGVEEKSKDDAVAGSFPGIARADVDAVLQRLRQAVAVSISPSPHFDARALWGPAPEINLLADHAIICVSVPKGPNAPYVHKSGQIYRRIADGSEPKPESDRFILDQLWRRSDSVIQECREWVESDPELSKAEGDRPYVRLLLDADPWGDRDAWLDASITEIRDLLLAKGQIVGVPFDTVYTTATGFLGRQIAGSDPGVLGITWHLDRKLRSEICIPLNIHHPASEWTIASELKGFANADRFGELLVSNGFKTPRIVDLNILYNLITGICETKRAILSRANWTQGFSVKAIILNGWRTVPFLDMPIVIDEFEACGIPMLMSERVVTPPRAHPDAFIEVPEYGDIESLGVRYALQALAMVRPVFEAYGIPSWLPHTPAESGTRFITELLEIGPTALRVQAARTAKI
jgi:hypothetical protein